MSSVNVKQFLAAGGCMDLLSKIFKLNLEQSHGCLF